MLLHGKNLKNKYVKKGIEKHNEKVIKKIFTRDMKQCADEKIKSGIKLTSG